MSDRQIKLSELIRKNIEKAKKTITDKERSEDLIRSSLDEIKEALDFKVNFVTEKNIDSDYDTIHHVFVENSKSKRKSFLFLYYFHQVNIFPLMLNYDGEITKRCTNIDDLIDFLELLVATESFMIRILKASEDNEVIDNDEVDLF